MDKDRELVDAVIESEKRCVALEVELVRTRDLILEMARTVNSRTGMNVSRAFSMKCVSDISRIVMGEYLTEEMERSLHVEANKHLS